MRGDFHWPIDLRAAPTMSKCHKVLRHNGAAPGSGVQNRAASQPFTPGRDRGMKAAKSLLPQKPSQHLLLIKCIWKTDGEFAHEAGHRDH
jgi:hypothetical protein